MNELEALLREQLHKAADPIEVPVDEVAVLEAGRRARTARTLRWVVVGLALLAAASAAVFALWQGGAHDDRRAVPDPLQAPTVEPITPSPSVAPSSAHTPSGGPTGAPGTQSTSQPPTGTVGAAATLDLNFRDGTGKVRVQSDGDGVRFTGLDAGVTGSATLAAPSDGLVATRSGVPGAGWVLAVLPSEAAWASFVDGGSGLSLEAAMIPVPGTDLLAVGAKQDVPEATPRLIWGTTDGWVFTSDGRTLPSATFDSLWGAPSTHFVDDRWALTGRSMSFDGFSVMVTPLDTSLLAITNIGGKDADSIEFVLSLPAGADPASVTWDLGQEVSTAIGRETATLRDGRILVHEAFRAPRITDRWNASNLPTATYTNAVGERVTAPVWRP